MNQGQEQTVPIDKLEQKIGHILKKGDIFETVSGKWKVIDIGRGGKATYTVEKIE